MPAVKVKRLHAAAVIPRTWSEHAVGLDLHALILTSSGGSNTQSLPPRMTRRVRTGIAVEAPNGYCLTVWSRSGLAGKSIFVANAPGLIDPDFRGEIEILLYNGSLETFFIKHEDRVAQLVLLPYVPMQMEEVKELSETERGVAGFGSTGR